MEKIVKKEQLIGLFVGFILIVGLFSFGDYRNGETVDLSKHLSFGVYFVVVMYVFQTIDEFRKRKKNPGNDGDGLSKK
ncbi:hypothetical protein [Salisediminibacterium selenitireducens]|uniref:Uncharacterized protein n=1 Tax=Bacillus selenitireducens (strain ATCC 700615 / DSM 15326 / MLS10) TaxID=439292 RepID=D6XYH9_BACIE|nr:hypothetical protein [Salisediminibacterium selenitireducens]ADI00248.1 hypothetical protein Bsel_2751 [[Bacillus] selenitireducens MLS10]